MDTFFWFFWSFLVTYVVVGWVLDALEGRHHHTWTMWELNWGKGDEAFRSNFQHRTCETCGLRQERRSY